MRIVSVYILCQNYSKKYLQHLTLSHSYIQTPPSTKSVVYNAEQCKNSIYCLLLASGLDVHRHM
jgi:hypothetical protein